jgi:uncharacterized protein YjiS (DUF1127 family)
MSKHFRSTPSLFVQYHDLKLPQRTVDGRQIEGAGQRPQQNRDGSSHNQASSVRLRDDHIVLLAIDALLTLHASFKKWRNRQRTLRVLADLNDHQLRDIGFTRDGDKYRALAEYDEVRRGV